MKRLIPFLLALAAALVGLPSSATAQDTSAKPIVFGVAGPFTGPNAQFGVQIRMGVEQAARELNAVGGINGRPVQLVFEDDAGVQTEANKVALKLAGNDNLMAVIGHFNSSCSLAGRGIYQNADLVMFSPGSTNAEVTLGHDNVFRNIFTDEFQGRSLAELVKQEMGFQRVAVLHDNDDYGNGLANFFVERAEEIDLNVVDRKAYDRETTDFRPTLQSMINRRPQAIVIAGLYQQAGLITRQIREQGITLPILGSDGVFSDKYLEIAGRAAEGAIITTPFLFDEQDARAMRFFEAVKTESGREPDAWAALSYDAAMLLAQAMRDGATTRRAIQQYLAAITTKEKAYDGLTGLTYFDENGDCVKEVFKSVVQSGKFRKYTP